MPTPKAELMELHMGIFQNRLEKIKGMMNAVSLRMDMVGKSAVGGDLANTSDEQAGFDKQKAEFEAEFDRLDNEYKTIEGNLIDYENKVLILTELE